MIFPNITFTYGDNGITEVAIYHKAEIVVNAVMGSVGLEPTLQAIEAEKTICIANKETLVTAGHLVMDAAKQQGVPFYLLIVNILLFFRLCKGNKKKILKELF